MTTCSTKISHPFFIAVKYLIVFLPAFVSFVIINKYAVNIPSQDDYDAVLKFLSLWKNAPAADHLSLLFSQQNEHRLLSSRIIYVLYDALTGGINFRNLIFIGNLQLLLIFLIFLVFIQKALPRYWVTAGMVAGLCMFDLNNWENADFAMASIQNYGVILLFVASLFFYSLKGWWYWLPAAFLQIICTFSSGNGIIASAFVVLFNILNIYRINYTGSKYPATSMARLKVIAATLIFLIFSPLYFYKYIHIPHPKLLAPIEMLAWFFKFAGHHIYYGNNTLAVIAGILALSALAVILLYKFKAGLQGSMAPVISCAGFILCSMAVTAVFRSCNADFISSRYLIYPHLLMALLIVSLLIKLNNRRTAMPAVFLITIIMLASYNMNFRGGKKNMEILKTTLTTTDYYYPDKATAKNISDQSCRLKIYCIEENR